MAIFIKARHFKNSLKLHRDARLHINSLIITRSMWL